MASGVSGVLLSAEKRRGEYLPTQQSPVTLTTRWVESLRLVDYVAAPYVQPHAPGVKLRDARARFAPTVPL